MSRQNNLLIALSKQSWGRAEFAKRMVRELRAGGDSVRLIIHAATRPLFEGSDLAYDAVDDHMRGLVPLFLNDIVLGFRPDNIVYCDFFETVNYLRQLGVDNTEFLVQYDATLSSLDIWDHARTGGHIDFVGDRKEAIVVGNYDETIADFRRLDRTMVPVPIGDYSVNTKCVASLPEASRAEPGDRRREVLGVPEKGKLVLLATADWQHPRKESADILRMAYYVPLRLAQLISTLGDLVHLVHVGPRKLPVHAVLRKRYHWLPSCPSRSFDSLVAGADMLVSLNIAATSIGKALVSRLPVVVVMNSYPIGTMDEALRLNNGRLSPEFAVWLRETMPVFPFWVWPLGYYRFLTPILAANPYRTSLCCVELMKEEVAVECLRQVLYESRTREMIIQRQQSYAESIRELPTYYERLHCTY